MMQQHEQSDGLPACPFCKGAAFYESTCPEDHWIECELCHAQGPLCRTKAAAAEAWMRRAALLAQGAAPAAIVASVVLSDSSLQEVPQSSDPQCGCCGGTGWMVRDPDIGTDQECFACNGTGKYEDEQPAAQSGAVELPPLPEWVDACKGKDPEMDDLIAYAEKMREYARLSRAQAAPDEVQAAEARLYRDLTGDAMAMGYDGIPAALEALRVQAAPAVDLASVSDEREEVEPSPEILSSLDKVLSRPSAPAPVSEQAAAQTAGVPEGLIEILNEAAKIISEIPKHAEPKCLRYPIVDELEGFALMLAAHPQAAQAKESGNE